MRRLLFLIIASVPLTLAAQFGEQQVLPVYLGGCDGVQFVAAGDLDLDGDRDIVAASAFADAVVLFKNEGQLTFQTGAPMVFADGVSCAQVADLDADGDSDVVYTANLGGQTLWMENIGQGIFNFNFLSSGGIFACVADLDGDELLDVVIVSNNLIWMRNTGNGTFADGGVIRSEIHDPRQVAVGDLDNDGDADVACIVGGEDEITWMANDGTGNFAAPSHICYANYFSLELADLDNDGDLDLVADDGTTRSTWYTNDGSGNFEMQPVFDPSNVSGAYSTKCADLDADGDVDVVLASWDSIRVAMNLGGGMFAPVQFVAGGLIGIYWVDAADLDNDGDLEIMAASYADDQVTWYENLTFQTGVEEITGTAALLQVLPNPMADHALITWPTATDGQAQVVVLDLTGQVVQQLPMREGRAILERGPLAGGAYLLRCTDRSGAVASARLLVE